jgi:hypothetical protein
MTVRVNVLSDPLTNQNAQAFLVPLIRFRRLLQSSGIEINFFFRQTPVLFECDVLAISSRVFPGNFDTNRLALLSFLETAKSQVSKVLYFDRSSTPGNIVPEIVASVSTYYKTSLYRDRTLYLRSIYGGRLFAEYYHDRFGVEDEPSRHSMALKNAEDLGKLAVSWNTAFGCYSLFGPRLTSLYSKVQLNFLIRSPLRFRKPTRRRPIDVSCRMNTSYAHNTVAFQRRKMASLLSRHRRVDRISKLAYLRELARSKIVASPFGYSEINYKDFETFLAGAVLLKPDMSHLDTFPDIYASDETYVAHDWMLLDVVDRVEQLLSNENLRLSIARNGQQRYRESIASRDGAELFVNRFAEMIRNENPDVPNNLRTSPPKSSGQFGVK